MDLRQRIIECASSLFFKNGIKSITMSDIAAEAGISKRTLYETFRDKDDLLEACIYNHIQKSDREIAKIIESEENVIVTLMRFHSLQLTTMWSVGRTIANDLRRYHRELYLRVEAQQNHKITSFIPLLEKGVKQGLIRKDTPFDILLWLFSQQMRTVLDDERIPNERYSLTDYLSAMTLNFIRGMATLHGVEMIDCILKKEKSEHLK
jgi:AcrR family transcriptional regulator